MKLRRKSGREVGNWPQFIPVSPLSTGHGGPLLTRAEVGLLGSRALADVYTTAKLAEFSPGAGLSAGDLLPIHGGIPVWATPGHQSQANGVLIGWRSYDFCGGDSCVCG